MVCLYCGSRIGVFGTPEEIGMSKKCMSCNFIHQCENAKPSCFKGIVWPEPQGTSTNEIPKN